MPPKKFQVFLEFGYQIANIENYILLTEYTCFILKGHISRAQNSLAIPSTRQRCVHMTEILQNLAYWFDTM